MENEKEFILRRFQESFGEDKEKKIVIYGIGGCTRYILEHFTEHQVIGLMHQDRMGEIWFGKEIISLEEAKKRDVDFILIVARANAIRIVYNRIYEDCMKAGIPVYDIHRKNLLEYYQNKPGEDYSSKILGINPADLIHQIEENDVISFDVFDTLITRKVLYPTDVFHLIERTSKLEAGFCEARLKAEATLVNPDLDQIYERVAAEIGLPFSEVEYLKEKEIDIEKSLITCRKDVVDFFQYAKECGKEIYLVSDMYLSKKIIANLLEGVGITGYKELLVSCEHGTTKTGYLFSELRERCGERKCLHIGDNFQADIVSARNSGFSAFYIPKGLDILKASACREILCYTDTLENRMAIGLLVERLFNSPFQCCDDNGRVVISDLYEFSYSLIAPFMVKYMYWMTEEIIKTEPDYVIFPSRDGFLMKWLYENLKGRGRLKLPEGVYFYISRMAAMRACIENEQDILDLFHIEYQGTVEDMLEARFLLERQDIIPYDDKAFESKDAYALMHKQQILKKAKEQRDNYLEYIAGFHLKKENKLVFCEFVSSGTSQKNLSRLINAKITGLYVLRLYDRDMEKQTLDIKALYKNHHFFSNDEYLTVCYSFLELIFSSYEPTMWKVGTGGNICFAEEKRSQEELESLKIMHHGIIDFIEQYLKYLPEIKHDRYSLKLCDTLLSFFQNNFTDIRRDEIVHAFLPDELCNTSVDLNKIFHVFQ